MSTNSILAGGGLHHVAIKTTQWEKTLHFYQMVLGFTTRLEWNKPPSRAAYLDAGDGSCVEVFEDLKFDPTPNGVIPHFCLRTTRLDEVCERVRAYGARITLEPKDAVLHSTNGVGDRAIRLCFFDGPNGESIELLQNAP